MRKVTLLIITGFFIQALAVCDAAPVNFRQRLLMDFGWKFSQTDAVQSDVAQVKVEVIDKNGYIVPDANNLIQLTIEGAGNLVGFDNGNR